MNIIQWRCSCIQGVYCGRTLQILECSRNESVIYGWAQRSRPRLKVCLVKSFYISSVTGSTKIFCCLSAGQLRKSFEHPSILPTLTAWTTIFFVNQWSGRLWVLVILKGTLKTEVMSVPQWTFWIYEEFLSKKVQTWCSSKKKRSVSVIRIGVVGRLIHVFLIMVINHFWNEYLGSMQNVL